MTAYAEVPFYDFEPDEYRLGLESYYLSTEANYNSSGNSEDLTSGFGYTQLGGNFYGRYTWDKRYSFFGGSHLRNVQAENSIEKKSTFALPGAFIGMNYMLGSYYFDVISEFKFFYPINKYDETNSDASSSEGVITFEAGSHFYRFFSNFLFHGYGSFEYKSEDFSSLFHYKADVYYFIGNFALSTGLQGFLPVTSDSNDDTLRATYIFRNSGGSFIYNAKEPHRLDLNLQIGYVANEFSRLYLELKKSLRGERSADYYQALLGYEYRFGEADDAVYYDTDDYLSDEDFKFDDEEKAPEFQEEVKVLSKARAKTKTKKISKQIQNDIEESKKDFEALDEKTSGKSNKKKIKKKSNVKSSGKKKRIHINF